MTKQDLLTKIRIYNSNRESDILSLIEECLYLNVQNNSENFSCIGEVKTPLKFSLEEIKQLKLIGKINLSDLNFLTKNVPKEGILLFYISINDIGYRFPYYQNEYKVIYISELDLINEFNIINKSNLIFKNSISIPSYQESIIDSKEFDYSDLNIINEIEDIIQSNFHNLDYDINHQIFGHPVSIQGTVRFWWALNYFGFKYEDVDKLTEKNILNIKKEEDNFVLLLQINFGDSKININSGIFGDAIAYYGIHKDDLIKLDFNKVVLIMQNS